jgi:hypothetical protein
MGLQKKILDRHFRPPTPIYIANFILSLKSTFSKRFHHQTLGIVVEHERLSSIEMNLEKFGFPKFEDLMFKNDLFYI